MKDKIIITKSRKSEGGYIMTIASFLIIVMILIGGLAIDSSNKYLTKLRIQRAVDGAAISGSSIIGTEEGDKALDVAQTFAKASLEAMGYDPSTIETNATWGTDTGNTEVSVSAVINRKNFIMGMLPDMPDSADIGATGRSATSRAVTCLALDTSGSMKENVASVADTTRITELYDGGITFTENIKRQKITHMKVALEKFLDLFQESEDYIAIVSFGLNAKVVLPMTTNFKDPELMRTTYETGPSGTTNTEHALRLCAEQMKNVDDNIRMASISSVILITDGAPTRSCKNEGDISRGQFFSNNVNTSCNLERFSHTDDALNNIHYSRAIHAADNLREVSGIPTTIFSVGLGPFNGVGSISAEELEARDAYQSIRDQGKRIVKSNFLMRISLQEPKKYPDLGLPLNAQFPIDYFTPTLTLPAPLRFEDYPSEHTIVPSGEAFITSDPARLTEILNRIGNKIKARLVG